jgi:integrase
LTEREIEKLIEEAKSNRQGHRDATAMLIAYRHGLRASELVSLRWDDIDFQTGKLHVRRAKGGSASVQPIGGRDLGVSTVCFGSNKEIIGTSRHAPC